MDSSDDVVIDIADGGYGSLPLHSLKIETKERKNRFSS